MCIIFIEIYVCSYVYKYNIRRKSFYKKFDKINHLLLLLKLYVVINRSTK